MADPTVIDCSSACTVTVVHELSLPPLQMDLEGAGAVAGAVVLVWAAGWAFRTLIRVLRDSDRSELED